MIIQFMNYEEWFNSLPPHQKRHMADIVLEWQLDQDLKELFATLARPKPRPKAKSKPQNDASIKPTPITNEEIFDLAKFLNIRIKDL